MSKVKKTVGYRRRIDGFHVNCNELEVPNLGTDSGYSLLHLRPCTRCVVIVKQDIGGYV